MVGEWGRARARVPNQPHICESFVWSYFSTCTHFHASRAFAVGATSTCLPGSWTRTWPGGTTSMDAPLHCEQTHLHIIFSQTGVWVCFYFHASLAHLGVVVNASWTLLACIRPFYRSTYCSRGLSYSCESCRVSWPGITRQPTTTWHVFFLLFTTGFPLRSCHIISTHASIRLLVLFALVVLLHSMYTCLYVSIHLSPTHAYYVK